MTRIELALALAGPLFAAFALGWAARWLWERVSDADSPRTDRADELAAELLIVEAEREREREAQAAAAAALREETAAERAAMAARLREREAELDALSSGLRAAREEIAALKGGA